MRHVDPRRAALATLGALVAVAAATLAFAAATFDPPAASSTAEADPVRGRYLVTVYDCGACHGGGANPAAEGWLAGRTEPPFAVTIGDFLLRPRNLTPDPETGTGRYTERQIFNAIRFGLRPDRTPDVEVTSPVPGEGGHPASPVYLSPAMPWAAFRHAPDQDLRDIAAYIKRALQPVRHEFPANGWPGDGWAGAHAPELIGAHPAPPFPTPHERSLSGDAPPDVTLPMILRGRALVLASGCGDCHGGAREPALDGWLAGARSPEQEFQIGPFRTIPRNLTPDNTTGLGRFTERQIFNALRYGLRPGDTPDMEITSATPGVGNHPMNPKYLAPPMPWPAFRHRPDDELRAIAAYLKYGLAPVEHRVTDSQGPPDFWAEFYAGEEFQGFPAPPFPTRNERVPAPDAVTVVR